MKSLTLRRTTAAAALALSLGSLAACGGDDEGDPAAEETTSDSSEASATDQPTETETSAPATGGEEIDAADFVEVYSTALDNATTAELTMTFDGPQTLSMTGAIDFSQQPPATRMNIENPATGETQEILLVDGAIYFKSPGAGGKYIKTDLESSPLGAGGGAVDPTALLESFEKGIVTVTFFGEEDVDGEALEHYNVVLDSQALLEASGETEAAEQPGVPAELPIDLYFGDDLLRRVVLDLGPGAGTVEVHYDNWGADITIEAPPADQVQELPGS